MKHFRAENISISFDSSAPKEFGKRIGCLFNVNKVCPELDASLRRKVQPDVRWWLYLRATCRYHHLRYVHFQKHPPHVMARPRSRLCYFIAIPFDRRECRMPSQASRFPDAPYCWEFERSFCDVQARVRPLLCRARSFRPVQFRSAAAAAGSSSVECFIQ